MGSDYSSFEFDASVLFKLSTEVSTSVDTSVSDAFTSVPTEELDGVVLPFQAEPASVEYAGPNIVPFVVPSELQVSDKLENPLGKQIEQARLEVMAKGLDLWTIGKESYSPEGMKILSNLAQVIAKANHVLLPDEEILVLTTSDFNSVVAVIKRLAREEGWR
jgi:hypothetical protein